MVEENHGFKHARGPAFPLEYKESPIDRIKRYFKHFKKGIVWLLLLVLTLFIGAIFQTPITNLVKSHVLNEEPYPQITITQIYRIPNVEFVNFSELKPKESGSMEFFAHHFEEGNLFSKTLMIREDTKDVFFVENNTWIKGLMFPTDYINNSGRVYQPNCVFCFYSNIMKGSNPENNQITSSMYWPAKIEDNLTNTTEFGISLFNGGTESVEDIYIKICPDNGKIVKIVGDASINENCMEIEIPFLYPEQRKLFSVYVSGKNLGKITFHSNMDKRKISKYIVNSILIVYSNSTCNKQNNVTMNSNEFGLLIEDLYDEYK